jgi:hypothetical protein
VHHIRYREVRQFAIFATAAQQQASAAHISQAQKIARESEPRSKNGDEWIDIFQRGDAAEQYDFYTDAELLRENPSVSLQWIAKARIRMERPHG